MVFTLVERRVVWLILVFPRKRCHFTVYFLYYAERVIYMLNLHVIVFASVVLKL